MLIDKSMAEVHSEVGGTKEIDASRVTFFPLFSLLDNVRVLLIQDKRSILSQISVLGGTKPETTEI